MADFVAEVFCPSECVRLIQDQASMRNVDSRIHSLRFDCCVFLFYSFSAVTFATKSAEVDIEKLPPAHSVPAPTVRPPRQSLWVKAVSGLAATHSEESIFAQVKGQFGRRCLGPLSARPPPSKTPGEKPGAFAFVRKLVLTDQYQPPSL